MFSFTFKFHVSDELHVVSLGTRVDCLLACQPVFSGSIACFLDTVKTATMIAFLPGFLAWLLATAATRLLYLVGFLPWQFDVSY